MKHSKRETLLDKIVAEKVNLGGTLMTRAQVIRRLTADGQPPACIDRFAFASPALSKEQQVQFRAICKCGCKMLSVFDKQISSCGYCEK